MVGHRGRGGATALTVALVIALLCAATVTAAEDAAASRPTTLPRRAAASFLFVLIFLLVVFVAFVAVMIALRNRLVPRRRVRKRVPTDSSDLWSLAGKIKTQPKPGEQDNGHGAADEDSPS